ncbi:MAG: Asp23/Gls24 family envelope stress response protein [Eubacterium sp.]|nr:Asp23/Gls24 family envelope stress response protein [Eubacterium sp.]
MDVKNSHVISDVPELGAVYVTESVLGVISAMAALEVDGVHAMAGGITHEMVAKTGMKKLAKSVHVDVNENQVSISLKIVVKMNENIIKISKKVQDKVKQTVENMTCLDVVNVDVNIASVGE